MRLLCEAERGVRPHQGKCPYLEGSQLTDNTIDQMIPLLLPVPRVEDPVLHQRWGSNPKEAGLGGGPGRRAV